MAPSIASQDQSSPIRASYSSSPRAQRVTNTPAEVHSWNRRCAELLEQMPVAFRAFH
jgi:hypothetical protein